MRGSPLNPASAYDLGRDDAHDERQEWLAARVARDEEWEEMVRFYEAEIEQHTPPGEVAVTDTGATRHSPPPGNAPVSNPREKTTAAPAAQEQ